MAKVNIKKTLEVTARGRVIARFVPEQDPAAAARERLKALRGKARITGNIMSPSGERWEVDTAGKPRLPRVLL